MLNVVHQIKYSDTYLSIEQTTSIQSTEHHCPLCDHPLRSFDTPTSLTYSYYTPSASDYYFESYRSIFSKQYSSDLLLRGPPAIS